MSHRAHVRPVEAATAQQHVPDERLDRRFPNEPDEKQLLDHLRGHRPQGWQSKQQLAEPRRLIRVLSPAVFLQGALRLFLKGLDVRHVRQSARI